jgi:2-polyprenyl-3-methyl-5-hydroxy-6-metoxy-1,4-benzoquinol methylase
MVNNIFENLSSLKLTSKTTAIEFSDSTRDVPGLKVWRDKASGVIYIKDHYVGDTEYQKSKYREWSPVKGNDHDFEEDRNTLRRSSDYKNYFYGKVVCDFGCGSGRVLKEIMQTSKEVVGVEIQEKHITQLRENGIKCLTNLSDKFDEYFDTISMFHVLEHMPDPLITLAKLHRSLKKDGKIIVEVPHANEFLLQDIAFCEDYKNFTLWSQHLILHTRESLRAFLEKSGFRVDFISGVQRYPLSNHLNWLTKGKPGGHKGDFSVIDNKFLDHEYAASLNRIDATDTLVAVASKY